MKIGDLVKMNRGYSQPGIIIEVCESSASGKRKDGGKVPDWTWCRIMWSDEMGSTLEKTRDLKLIRASR